MDKQRVIDSIGFLAHDIDECINDIVAARLSKDDHKEGRALFKMESLIVASIQQLSYLREFIEDYVEDE